MGVVLRPHPVCGESHIQLNADGEVATPDTRIFRRCWSPTCKFRIETFNDRPMHYIKKYERQRVVPVAHLCLFRFLHFDIQSTGKKSHCAHTRWRPSWCCALINQPPGPLARTCPPTPGPHQFKAACSTLAEAHKGQAASRGQHRPLSQSSSRCHGPGLPTPHPPTLFHRQEPALTFADLLEVFMTFAQSLSETGCEVWSLSETECEVREKTSEKSFISSTFCFTTKIFFVPQQLCFCFTAKVLTFHLHFWSSVGCLVSTATSTLAWSKTPQLNFIDILFYDTEWQPAPLPDREVLDLQDERRKQLWSRHQHTVAQRVENKHLGTRHMTLAIKRQLPGFSLYKWLH